MRRTLPLQRRKRQALSYVHPGEETTSLPSGYCNLAIGLLVALPAGVLIPGGGTVLAHTLPGAERQSFAWVTTKHMSILRIIKARLHRKVDAFRGEACKQASFQDRVQVTSGVCLRSFFCGSNPESRLQ